MTKDDLIFIASSIATVIAFPNVQLDNPKGKQIVDDRFDNWFKFFSDKYQEKKKP